jgi:AcrR family transcriptional regulator
MGRPPGDARLRLIEAAERLFAEQGVHGVSLREIGVQAGQRNTAAARYHFGSKESLVDAVFEHRMTPINARRENLLEQADQDGRGHEPRFLVEAFLLPLASALGDRDKPSWYLRFAVHAGFLADLGRQPWTRGVVTVRDRLTAQLTHLPEPLRAERFTLLSGYLAHALADREMALQYSATELTDRSDFLSTLTDTAVALVLAPRLTGAPQ